MKQTAFRTFIIGGTVTAVGPIVITFPVPLGLNESTNATVAIGAGVAADVLAANAARQSAQIVNLSGNTLRISLGGAAIATDLEFPTGSVFRIEPDTLGRVSLAAVSVFNPTGGALNVTVQEFLRA